MQKYFFYWILSICMINNCMMESLQKNVTMNVRKFSPDLSRTSISFKGLMSRFVMKLVGWKIFLLLTSLECDYFMLIVNFFPWHLICTHMNVKFRPDHKLEVCMLYTCFKQLK